MTSRLPRASRKIIQRTEAPKMITSRTITTAMPVIRITIPNRNIVGTTIPGESGGNTDTPENGENTNKPDNSGTTDNSGDTGESGDTGGGNVQ